MKSVQFLTLLTLLTTRLYAQHIELQLSGGQGFSIGGVPMSSYDQTINTGGGEILTTIQNRQDKYYSIGDGTRAEGRLIIFVADNIGIFAQCSYSKGSQSSQTYQLEDDLYPAYSTNTTIQYSSVSVQAGLHFQSQQGILQPFGGAGAGYFFPRKLTLNESSGNLQTETEETTNAPLVYTGYLGLNLRLTPNFSVFVETKATLITYYIIRKEITKEFLDGADVLGSLTTYEKITLYEENKNYSESPGYLDFPAYGGPPMPAPGGTLAITAGVSFAL